MHFQFCQISYREVLYRNILHKHKRNLHRLVAKILQKQKEDIAYQFDTSYNKQWDMQERLCHHLKALMSSNKSQKGSFANDLRMYTDAVRWLAKGHLKSGQVKEALNRQVRLPLLILACGSVFADEYRSRRSLLVRAHKRSAFPGGFTDPAAGMAQPAISIEQCQ